MEPRKFKRLGHANVTFTEIEALLLLARIGLKKNTFIKRDQKFVEQLLEDLSQHIYGDSFESGTDYILKTIFKGRNKEINL